MDVWQKLEVLKSSDNWIEVKTLDGKTLRFSKASPGSKTKPGDQGYADLDNFDCPPGDEPKRKVVVGLGPTKQSVPTTGLPLKNVQRTFMELPGDPTAVPPKLERTVEGTPNPPVGGCIRKCSWNAATETLTNTEFWDEPVPE